MPVPGHLNKRCVFSRRAETSDDYGNVDGAWTDFLTVWGGLRIESGAESLEAGRLEASLGAVLSIRASSEAAAITEDCRVMIDGIVWNIRTIINRDQRGKYLEIRVEKGVAV